MANEIDFLFYNLPDDEGKVQVIIKDETIWATQKAMSQLFDVGVPDISKHLKKKFESGELDKDVVVSKMEITTQHGAIEDKTQVSETAFYSLDAIIDFPFVFVWTTSDYLSFIVSSFFFAMKMCDFC